MVKPPLCHSVATQVESVADVPWLAGGWGRQGVEAGIEVAVEEINPRHLFQMLPPLPPMRGRVQAVLKRGMEKLPMPIEAEAVVKVTLRRDTKEEMSSEARVLPMKAAGKPLEPPVQAMAASGSEKEFTAGEGWRPSQQPRQEHGEQRAEMCLHRSSPIPTAGGSHRPESRGDPRPSQKAKTVTPRSQRAVLPPVVPDAGR